MNIYTKSRALADKLITKFANEESCTIERKVETPDGQGGFTLDWSALYSDLQCAVVPMSGNEVMEAQRLNYEATHNVYLRFSDALDLRSDDRIIFDSRVFIVRDPRNLAEAKAAYKVRVQENVA